MAVPRPIMEKDLKNEEKGLTDELESLGKKVPLYPPGSYMHTSRVTAVEVPREAVQRCTVATARYRELLEFMDMEPRLTSRVVP